ncbi:MAG: benzoyl-CoA reductase subunit D [Planctomycetaceae bacterium]|nr:Benzoyl-CoA reductase subunit D [Planctomycetota bacterium]MCQ3948260.1 benzoyl-CoA reductase subunit D [Planctomycetota bacterium]NUO14861.1 benzoyl-CoA reductase subunit D [Planctomycetaceae bacterium]GIK52848.1 MAG: 2-hydroxyglutaryl-CoA dehydratase [Planctomycetota bacterium]HRJ77493.1 benzoyl-CoA reductase subunit D [Planctomycetota bacterium]
MAITAGVDVGTGAVKVAVMRAGDSCARDELLGSYFERIRRRDVMSVVDECFEAALKQAGLRKDQLDYIATTGEGDMIPWRTGHFYGMTTHARGALFLDPKARGAIDVGALHARAMRFDEHGRVLEYRMTSQCASGSGQFVENIARYLGVSLDDVGPLSQKGTKPERVSGICAVLAETDVINMVSRGISTPDILRGIHDSISVRLAGLIRGIKISGVLMITGGLAADSGLVAALKDKLKDGAAAIELRQHALSVHAGAIGAALWGAFRHGKLAKETEAAHAGGT